MTKQELKERFLEALNRAFTEVNPIIYADSYISRMLHVMRFMTGKIMVLTGYTHNRRLQTDFEIANDTEKKLPSDYKKKERERLDKEMKNFSVPETYLQILRYLDENNIVYFTHRSFCQLYVILEDCVIMLEDDVEGKGYTQFINETGETPEWFEANIRYKDAKEENTYKYVVRGERGFTTRPLNINDIKVDLCVNYNDDLPDEEIKTFLMGDKPGIVILHGEPGTGKSTYVRHLITTLDKDFLYLDGSCFDYLTDASFIELLFQNKNAIIVLEDSEKLLRKRTETSFNNQVSPLLNLTDGLLGDSMKLKVICTFNAPLDKIDDAILRKGRLKVKYLFNKLNKDKSKKLLNKLGIQDSSDKEYTLADIYNYAEQVDFGEQKRKSVGF